MKKLPLLAIAVGVCLIIIGIGSKFGLFSSPTTTPSSLSNSPSPTASPSASPTSPPPTPTPTLSFTDKNKLWGPCAIVPTLMYHHIQPLDAAKSKNQQNLTVSPEFFEQHLSYISSHNYHPITMTQLISFFDTNTPLPSKPIIITIDDGYQDSFDYAIPLLNKFGYPATIFIPTGLIENPDYLTWSEIKTSSTSILFANHTWSHRNVASSADIIDKEIGTADKQLAEKELNFPKVFAYPYGLNNKTDLPILQKYNYQLAFTTVPGSVLCRQKRLELPRIRIGDTQLKSYGL